MASEPKLENGWNRRQKCASCKQKWDSVENDFMNFSRLSWHCWLFSHLEYFVLFCIGFQFGSFVLLQINPLFPFAIVFWWCMYLEFSILIGGLVLLQFVSPPIFFYRFSVYWFRFSRLAGMRCTFVVTNFVNIPYNFIISRKLNCLVWKNGSGQSRKFARRW